MVDAPANRLAMLLMDRILERITTGFAMFSVLRRRRRTNEISVGARYCRRDAPHIVWEVYSLFVGTDGMPYAGIFCISDQTRRKTVSQSVLEHDGQYTRVADE
jgi:hypothetical protein